MNINSMKAPNTRSEFEHRFNLLRAAIKNGKMRFMQGTGDSLLNVRYLPNGRIDFLSVDESARAQANMMINMSNIPRPQRGES